MCHYPNCKGEPVITLAYADSIRLCERHWEQCCEIELVENATISQCIAHERKQLQFHRRCGSEGAAKSLRKLAADRESYKLKCITIKGERATVAEHRERLAAKAAAAKDEPAEAGEPFDPERHGKEYCRACELYECECEDESDQDGEDFFGDFD